MRSGALGCAALLALLLLAVGPVDSARADRQTKLEQACASHRGISNAIDLRYVTNAATCTENCYYYTLICMDATRFSMSSRYPPFATETGIFFYENNAGAVILKLVLFAAVGFFALAAAFGSKRPRERVMYENGGIVLLFGVTLYLWGTGHIEEWHYSLGRFLDFVLGSTMLWVVLPVFVVINGTAFVRGCNYLFVAHPAAPIVRPSMRGQSADVEGLAEVLVEGAQDQGAGPAFHYENQAEKARALAQKLNEDSSVAEAKAKRELRRAELAQAERALGEARKQKGKADER